MRSMPTILAVLSFPAGALGYALALRVIETLPLPEWTHGFLVLVVPLFIAGLVMMPFLIPFFDRKAKEDLAAIARSREEAAQRTDETPGVED